MSALAERLQKIGGGFAVCIVLILGLSGCTLAIRGQVTDTTAGTGTSSPTPPPSPTPPAPPSALSLNTPSVSPGSSSTLTIEVAGVAAGYTVRLYEDNTCTGTVIDSGTAIGSTILLATSALSAGNHTFYATAGNAAGFSACSTASVTYLYSLPAPSPSGLSWLENSPAATNVVNAVWIRSTSPTLSNQKIQFYSDGTCGTPAGGLVDLSSATQELYPFTGSYSTTYSFKITSVKADGLESVSGCSSALSIPANPLKLGPAYLAYPVGTAISQAFAGASGSGSGYTYAVLSGPGSVHPTSGLYTAAVGTRAPGNLTQLQVTDSAAATASATIRHDRLSVNGTVYTAVSDGTSVWVGGKFTAAHPDAAYGLMAVDPASGDQLDRSLSASFNGPVYAAQISGDTAYFGGAFTKYRGITVQNLVKINLVTGALDTTFSQATGPDYPVLSLALSGTALYVGGSFNYYRGNNRGYRLLKLDSRTGAMDTTSFNATASAGPSGAVYALAATADALFVGGSFNTYRGDTRGANLAKVSKADGALEITIFNSAATGFDGSVHSLALYGNSIFAAGWFSNYRGDSRASYLAKLDQTTGAMDTVGFNSVAPCNSFATALTITGNTLYVGGYFTAYRGDNKGYRLAKVDADTGVMDTANFNTIASSGPGTTVTALHLSGSSLYVAGHFRDYRGDTRGDYLAKVNATTGVLDTASFNTLDSRGPKTHVSEVESPTGYTWSANIGYGIQVLTTVGGRLYVGGSFSTYRGGTPVQNLAKFRLSDWTLDTTFTQSTGADQPVHSLALSGSSLYAGGSFNSYRGDSRGYKLLKLDATTGAMDTAFNSSAGSGPSGSVMALLVSGSDLYVGGSFSLYRSDNRGKRLAKVSATTGVMDTAFNSVANDGPDGTVNAILLTGGSLYIGGGFNNYRSDPKGYRLAKLDPATGVMDTAGFNTTATTGPSGTVHALAATATALYVGGHFSSYRGNSDGAYVAKVDLASGALDTVSYNTGSGKVPGGYVYSLYASGSALYIGGSHSFYQNNGSGARLTKVNLTTGVMDATFNASGSTSVASGSATAQDQGLAYVFAIAPAGSSVVAVGAFSYYRGNPGSPNVIQVDATTAAEQ